MDRTVIVGCVATSGGSYGAVFSARGLCCLTYPEETSAYGAAWAAKHLPDSVPIADDGRLVELGSQLNAYFAGTLRRFTVALDLHGTAFQLRVWQALVALAYGQVRTYAQIAAALGTPRAARAVGAANGANPVPILVPCHRLVGSDGRLVRYGGGLELKRRLLALEGVELEAATSEFRLAERTRLHIP